MYDVVTVSVRHMFLVYGMTATPTQQQVEHHVYVNMYSNTGLLPMAEEIIWTYERFQSLII